MLSLSPLQAAPGRLVAGLGLCGRDLRASGLPPGAILSIWRNGFLAGLVHTGLTVPCALGRLYLSHLIRLKIFRRLPPGG